MKRKHHDKTILQGGEIMVTGHGCVWIPLDAAHVNDVEAWFREDQSFATCAPIILDRLHYELDYRAETKVFRLYIEWQTTGAVEIEWKVW